MLVVFLINEALKEYIFHNSIYVNLFKCKIQKNFCIVKLYVFCIFENVSHFEQRGIIKYSVFDILIYTLYFPSCPIFRAMFFSKCSILSKTFFKHWAIAALLCFLCARRNMLKRVHIMSLIKNGVIHHIRWMDG